MWWGGVEGLGVSKQVGGGGEGGRRQLCLFVFEEGGMGVGSTEANHASSPIPPHTCCLSMMTSHNTDAAEAGEHVHVSVWGPGRGV